MGPVEAAPGPRLLETHKAHSHPVHEQMLGQRDQPVRAHRVGHEVEHQLYAQVGRIECRVLWALQHRQQLLEELLVHAALLVCNYKSTNAYNCFTQKLLKSEAESTVHRVQMQGIEYVLICELGVLGVRVAPPALVEFGE